MKSKKNFFFISAAANCLPLAFFFSRNPREMLASDPETTAATISGTVAGKSRKFHRLAGKCRISFVRPDPDSLAAGTGVVLNSFGKFYRSPFIRTCLKLPYDRLLRFLISLRKKKEIKLIGTKTCKYTDF